MERRELAPALLQAAGLAKSRIPLPAGDSPTLLCETDPHRFVQLFAQCLEEGRSAALASPQWGINRLEEARILLSEAAPQLPAGAILIATGGTTGRLRFCVHSVETLCASAAGFLSFYGGTPHRALCVLPHWHVSGLMQLFRAALSGGRATFGEPSHPEALPAEFEAEGAFLSLVPTQLARLLDAGAEDFLRGFAAVVIGGAGLDPALAAKARAAKIPLSPSYGMTETAAVCCALSPSEFLAGAEGVGRALPHAALEVAPGAARESPQRIRIRTASLCRGFAPWTGPIGAVLETSDLGYFDEKGSLHVTGRADRAIVCGGEKLDAGEIERAILTGGGVREVCVTGLPDEKWGFIAAAFYVPDGSDTGTETLAEAVRKTLSPRHVPKFWKALPALPRTAAGKIDLETLRKLAGR
jgi:O-succinylbenzoic acid--CoA ligase